MITKNFKNLLAMIAESSGSVKGCVPAIDTTGRPVFLNGAFDSGSFPGTRTAGITLTANAAGISVGSGTSTPLDTDYQLESHISSDISLTLTNTVLGCDEYGSPYVQYNLTVTNTGSSEITISEVGYKQILPCVYKATLTTNIKTLFFLLDRTVLSTPLTLAAGDAGVIQYKITTYPQAHQTKEGVELVSFTHGTDEQIAAMIDAAQQGKIDLQSDAGWAVGDMRTISVGAWTGGGSTSHVAQDINIIITSFDDYNNCGSVLQFDFFECFAGTQRMHSSATTVGGYGGSEMHETTLPALVEALPSWLKSRLKTFSVLVSEGNDSSTIETVGNNKLALRSEKEITDTNTYSKAGEGSQIPFYKGWKAKGLGIASTTSYTSYFTRSPNNATTYAVVTNSSTPNYSNANSKNGLAPFGCL